ncbi:MAG: CPBP family intramembrane glutamic endopeptidase [Enterococcus sp.]
MTNTLEKTNTSKNSAVIAFILTIAVGIAYQLLGKTLSPDTPAILAYPLEALFNLCLCGTIGYFFLRTEFLEQFKHFKLSVLLWGIVLTFAVGILFGQIYQHLAGSVTENTIHSSISISMILFRIPFMLLGEELISTNILIAVQKKGFSFPVATIVCGILFAFWHIPAYGFVPLQLILTLMPTRLALNYIWRKSNSVWVSWICHYLFDCFAFLPYFI